MSKVTLAFGDQKNTAHKMPVTRNKRKSDFFVIGNIKKVAKTKGETAETIKYLENKCNSFQEKHEILTQKCDFLEKENKEKIEKLRNCSLK